MIESSSEQLPLNETPSAPPIDTAPPRLSLPVTRPLVTYALLAAILVIFGASLLIEQSATSLTTDPILAFGVIDYNRILRFGEWYRLLTAIFIHLSPTHIFFNAYALWLFGRTVEGVFGHIRFAVIYFVGGLSGSLASFIIGREDSAGASGAIFAIIAAEMVFLYWHRELLGERAGRALRELLILGGVNLGLGILSNLAPGAVAIDNWGHIGGFVGGLITASLIAPRFAVVVEAGIPHVVDERPFTERWPLAVVCGGALMVNALVAAVTLPR